MKLNFGSPAKEHLNLAKAKYHEKQYQAALKDLKWGFIKDNSYKPLYKLAVEILEQLDANEEENLFRNALSNFKSFKPFFDLGYHFIDVGEYNLARPFLERALRINPRNTDAAYELSLAYTKRFNVQKGLEVLAKIDISQDFWATYRFHLCRLWNYQVDGIQSFIDQTQEWLKSREENEDTRLVRHNIEVLDEMLTRYNLLDRPKLHVREWHFVQYGSAILDYETDEDVVDATNGRYVALGGSMESVRAVLEMLKLFLEKTNRNPTKVISIQNRDTEIIAIATSKLLNVPFEFLNEHNGSEENTLIVAADNQSFNGVEQVIPIKKEQTVFALNLNWFVDAMICPDVAGFMTQTYVFPWRGGGFQIINTDPLEIEKTRPDHRNAEEIADNLVKIEPEISQSFDETLDFYEQVIDYLKGQKNGGQKRLDFAVDSPVPSSYFIG